MRRISLDGDLGKILKVPDTRTLVLDNTRTVLCSSIRIRWMVHVGYVLHHVNSQIFSNTGTLEMVQYYHAILVHTSIWIIEYTFPSTVLTKIS